MRDDIEGTDQKVGTSGASNIIFCPTCDRPLDALPSICCDRCETWFHFDCEQIRPDMRSFLARSDIGYTCLGCSHLIECEGLNDSLNVQDRNPCEADPEPIDEETHRKEGYDPHFSNTSISPPVQRNKQTELAHNNSFSEILQGSETPNRNVSDSPIPIDQNPDPGAQPARSNSGETSLQNRPNHVSGQGVDFKNKDKATNRGKNAMGSVVDLNNEDGATNQANNNQKTNQNRVQKNIGKHKLKESEQEEQLKLARSVINSLERKVGGLENSNRILKENSLLRSSGAPNANQSTTPVNECGNPVAKPETHVMYPNGRINTNPVDSHTVGILKEQFKNMEIMMELVKNRTLNLELCLQQQRSNSGTRPGMLTHPVDSYQYGTEWPMHGPQPHSEGLPLYGQPAMHGHGGTQVGLRYVPQGYMHPATQHYYPVFPNVQIPQPVHGIHPVQVQGVPMQRQNPQGTSGTGIHNPHQTYAGPTLYRFSTLYGNVRIPQTRKTGQVDRENVGHMATSSNDGKTNMRDRQGVNESCMHRTTDMIAKRIDKHQKRNVRCE